MSLDFAARASRFKIVPFAQSVQRMAEPERLLLKISHDIADNSEELPRVGLSRIRHLERSTR